MGHADALLAGSRLAEFEILSLLGVGGFGMVYKAFDHSLHRAVAIKEYMPSALAGRLEGQSLQVRTSSDLASYQAGLASFVGEARLLAQFDHPSLVKVFRFWQANNTAYMVMPLYLGMTLKQARAHMRSPPPETWMRKLLWSVLSALRVLHDGRTLHRDVSPDNIFLQDSGPPVLLDLGAARHAINDQDRKHTAVLKVNYAPIEQYAMGDEDLLQGPWSDLYSLAAVVHGCLCNDTPLPATLRSIRDRMVPFSRVARTVHRQFGVEYSAPFVTAISQSLSLRPQDRPQSIDAFLQLMEMTDPPDGVEHFDFRAELGDLWDEPPVPPGLDSRWATTVGVAAPAPAPASVPVSVPAPAVRPADPLAGVTYRYGAGEHPAQRSAAKAGGGDTVFMDAGDTVAFDDSRYDDVSLNRFADQTVNLAGAVPSQEPPAAGGARTAADRKPRRWLWASLAVAVIGASAATLRWMQDARPPKDDIITELAERPASGAISLSGAASAVASDTPAQPVAAALAVTSAPTAAALPGAAGAASAPRANPRAVRRPVAEPAAEASAVPESVAVPAPAPAEVRPRPAATPRLPSPQEVCADSGFLARPMCIHRECQKPAQASQPICVETRQRYEAEEQRRRQTPN